MADATNELFVFGDDFETILNMLEEDEAIEKHFSTTAIDVQSADFVCSDCGKKYKTRGGYQRHRASKHNPNENDRQERTTLTLSSLAEIVKYAIQTVNRGRAFAPSLRNELNLYQFKQFDEGTDEFTVLKTIYDGYLKNGDVEKFYGKYYASGLRPQMKTLPLQSTKFFSGLSHNAATLLATKVADSMLVYCKSTKACCSSNHPTQTLLSEREKAGLQYVGGYVLHNLHKHHSVKKNSRAILLMAILKAGKLETGSDSQRLVSILSRGGLWSITKPAEKIFIRTKHYFRQMTSTVNLARVDIADIVGKSVSDSELLSNYYLLVSDDELVPDNHIVKDILHGIVHLYVRVRSFSFAKDIIQHHKINTKQSKAKALRKEISRSCEEQQQERLH
ncbi:unnamed protein product [Pocillopora meandrina]|uniref:C2H2-type domain-containing protein n=1 Tax=Pocillopora meandrina TaxID=46732 RepID=A0AAU9XL70_9CNID|nr:unnamed protein product [Pocillopora meandrina]